MKIAVTFAMEREFKPWRKIREFEPTDDGFLNRSRSSETVVFVTGIGPECAAESSWRVIEYAPDVCVISGLAGGLRAEYRPGMVLATRAVCVEDGNEPIEADEELVAIAAERGASIAGRLVSAKRIVRTVEQKAALGRFADAVDMESHVLISAMKDAGIPAISIRAVSDAAESAMPYDFSQALDLAGKIRTASFLGQIARSPSGLVPLARLAASSTRAAYALARFLNGYIEAIEQQHGITEPVLERAALR